MYRVANMLEVAVRKPSANCFLEKKNSKGKKSNKTRFLVEVCTTMSIFFSTTAVFVFICAYTRRLEQNEYITCTNVHTFSIRSSVICYLHKHMIRKPTPKLYVLVDTKRNGAFGTAE